MFWWNVGSVVVIIVTIDLMLTIRRKNRQTETMRR
jgi:hypothetical protein